ncbi:fibrinolytic enzyme, isozyme C-like [Watersipora subatra]|uniref:fibrinolytic enzyme, isozyme C-like n=1 Tax=Watersipora subatra TaxID=2589382 RepID=UPI00355B065C
MHESYQPNSAGFPNDIALLRVSQPISLNTKSATIRIPSAGMDFDGNTNCYISGWGLTQGSQDRTKLQELRVDIRTQSACERAWGSYYINSGHICVENGDTGACNGDSGGPLSCMVNGQMYLAGATSWGISGCQTRGYPSVYTRVSYFSGWLRENMMTYQA